MRFILNLVKCQRRGSLKMWPFIRLNPFGITLFIVICLGIYLIYSSSVMSPAQILLKKYRHRNKAFDLNSDLRLNTLDRNEFDDLKDFPPNEVINLKKLLMACIRAAEAGGREVVRVRYSADGIHERSKGKTKEGVKDPLTEGDLRSHMVMVHGLSATFPGLRIISEEEHDDTSDNDINIAIKSFHIPDKLMYNGEFLKLPHEVFAQFSDLAIWIDPLDATKEYTENLLQYVTTMVCVSENGRPIMGVIHKPFSNETFWGWVGHGVSKSVKSLLEMPNINTTDKIKLIVSRSHAGNMEEVAKNAFKDVSIISAGGAGYKILELINKKVDAYVHVTMIKKWDICAPHAILNAIPDGMFTTLIGNSISYNFDDDVHNPDGVLASVHKDHEHLVKSFKDALLKPIKYKHE